MGLSETVKDHIIVIVASAFAAGASLSWGVAEKIRVEPRDDEIARLEKVIAGFGAGGSPATPRSSESLDLQTSQTVTSSPNDTGPEEASPTISVSERIQNAEGFSFNLNSCKREGRDIYCTITVINGKQDEELRISRHSRLIDEGGNVHEKSTFDYSDGRTSNDLFLRLASGVPTTFGVRFRELGGRASQLALIELSCYEFNVQWRGIRVEEG
jgi:hypothetical protein